MMKKLKVLAIILVMLSIPVITGVFAFMQVYQSMTQPKLAIALVNDDKGTKFNGTDVFLGNSFVKDVEKNKDYDWKVVTRNVAEAGLANGTYDVLISLPSDFSEKSVAIDQQAPEKVELRYKISPTSNILMDEYAKKAVLNIQGMLNQKLIDLYFLSIINNLQIAQAKVTEIVENEIEHNGVLNKDITKDAETMQKNVTQLEQSNQSLASGNESQSKGADSTKEAAKNTQASHNGLYQDFTRYKTDAALTTDYAAKTLAKDQILYNNMLAMSKVLTQLETQVVEMRAKVDQSLIDITAISVAMEQTHTSLQNFVWHPNGMTQAPLWEQMRAGIYGTIPVDGALHGIQERVTPLCANITSYVVEKTAHVALQKMCAAKYPLGKNHSYQIGTLEAVDISGELGALDTTKATMVQVKLPHGGGRPSNVKMTIGRSEYTLGFSGDEANQHVFATSINFSSGVPRQIQQMSGAMMANSAQQVQLQGATIVLSDGIGIQSKGLPVWDVLRSEIELAAGQLQDLNMLQAYMLAVYNRDPAQLVAEGGANLAGHLDQVIANRKNEAPVVGHIDSMTNAAYQQIEPTLSGISDQMTAVQTGIGSYKAKLEAIITLQTTIETTIATLRADIDEIILQKEEIKEEMTTIVERLEKEKEVAVTLDTSHVKLVQMSESLVQLTQGQADGAKALSESAQSVAKDSEAAKSQSDLAVEALAKAIKKNDEILDANKTYNENFSQVLDNSSIGKRDNDDLYSFLSQPIMTNNSSRSINGAQTLLPYFTIILLVTSGLFTAHVFASWKHRLKDKHAAEGATSRMRQPLFMALFGIVEGLVIGGLSARIAQLVGTDLIGWTIVSALSGIIIIWCSYLLLKSFKNIGMLVIVLLLLMYLVLNGVLGYSLAKGDLLTIVRSLSPLWLLEGMYFRILFALPQSLLLNVGSLIVIMGAIFLGLLYVDRRKRVQ